MLAVGLLQSHLFGTLESYLMPAKSRMVARLKLRIPGNLLRDPRRYDHRGEIYIHSPYFHSFSQRSVQSGLVVDQNRELSEIWRQDLTLGAVEYRFLNRKIKESAYTTGRGVPSLS
jgi:hypothetical protein